MGRINGLRKWYDAQFRKVTEGDIVVIDSIFPQKSPFAFKNAEINEYFKKIPSFTSYTMYPMLPDGGAWFTHGYGVTYRQFKENKKGYLKHYAQNGKRIKYLFPNGRYKFKLAYTYFLAETYVLLPFLEKNNIPFIFVLYPGGGFGLNYDKSDRMLHRIFQSDVFRGVITTQDITKEYLINKNLCPKNKIHHIYGGFVQFKKDDLKRKVEYGKSKKTFDVCFVAAKYSEYGEDKGYDMFIKVAKKICKMTDDIMFHVVGGFDANDIDIVGFEHRIKFYGYKKPDFLVDFYSKMDVFLAPNQPYKLFKGNFDGFPLGIDAGYCGVALFVADELKMNRHYTDGKDIVIIQRRTKDIVSKIMHYYADTEKLYRLSKECQNKTQRLFDIDMQIKKRIDVFNKNIDKELA